jgi:hypothetical protein
MTVQEFYEWCKKRKLTDAELEISLKSLGRDNDSIPVTEMNIDYGKRKEPHKKDQIFVRFGC